VDLGMVWMGWESLGGFCCVRWEGFGVVSCGMMRGVGRW